VGQLFLLFWAKGLPKTVVEWHSLRFLVRSHIANDAVTPSPFTFASIINFGRPVLFTAFYACTKTPVVGFRMSISYVFPVDRAAAKKRSR
jgi:hypothetical protein